MSSTVAQMITSGANFNAAKDVSYGKVRLNANGGKSIPVLNATLSKPLHLSTPLMMTWGMNVNEFEAGKKTFDMSLQFPREQDANYSKETRDFLKNMAALEEKIKADAVENAKDWFGKSKMTPEVVDALWSPMLKYPKDPESQEPDKSREPTLRLIFCYYDGKFDKDLELYDLDHTFIYPKDGDDGEPDLTASPEELIQKTQNVAMVMKCGGIWFVGGKFGITWKVVQGMVQPRATLRGKCHINLDSASKERMLANAEVDEENDENVGVTVGDSEDEEEEEHDVAAEQDEEQDEEQEQEKPPSPPPKKKRVVRKKTGATTPS